MLDEKIFAVYSDESNTNKELTTHSGHDYKSNAPVIVKHSIKDFQQMKQSELDQKVFINIRALTNEVMYPSQVDERLTKFFSIKKTKFKASNINFTNIQIMDITSRIRFHKLIGEKNLLQMINACVSHEMRNPINSIHCQNMKLSEAAKIIIDLIESKDIKSIRQMRKELRMIADDINESTKIQLASTKLLNFYVNDMLSLA